MGARKCAFFFWFFADSVINEIYYFTLNHEVVFEFIQFKFFIFMVFS